ncbi:MAG: hypothetical protein ABIG89_03200 [Candidatus Woesearchaeota archaeon]
MILTSLIKPEYSKPIILVLFIIISVLTYVFIQAVHIIFCFRKSIKKSLSTAWHLLSERCTYMPLIVSALLFLVYLAIISLLSLMIMFIIFKTSQNMYNIEIYSKVIAIISGIVIYLLFLFNKVYYLLIVKQNIKTD